MCLGKIERKLVYKKFFRIVKFSSRFSSTVISFIEGLNIFFSRRNSQPSFLRHSCFMSSKRFLILEFLVFLLPRSQFRPTFSFLLFYFSPLILRSLTTVFFFSFYSLLFHEGRIQIVSIAIRFLPHSLPWIVERYIIYLSTM